MKLHVLCIDKRHNAVQAHVLRDGRLQEKRLRNRTGRSEPRGFDHHPVKLIPFRLDQRRQHVDKIRAHRAAYAPIVQHHDLLLVGVQRLLHSHELTVDIDLPKLVLNDRDSLTVGFVREYMIQQGRLPRPQKSGQDRHRYA